MTQKQKRIAIAKACRWKDVEFGVGPNSNLCLGNKPTWSNGTVISYTVDKVVPDYFNDLNACHEAEKMLQHYGAFVDCLATVAKQPRGGISLIHATAAQRAEAFGLTLGLWK
jgi:hypothetical protein